MNQKTIVIDMSNFMRMAYAAGRGLRDMALDLHKKSEECTRLIMVFDGYNANQYRRNIFTGYKVKTGQADLSEFFELQKFFHEQYMPLIKGISINIPYYEADDVIAAIAKQAKHPTEIHSTDQDYLILVQNKYVKCISKFEPKMNFPVEQMRLYKTLVGDASDKIPGLKGFGDSAFSKLTLAEKHQLEQAFRDEKTQPPEIENLTKGQKVNIVAMWSDLQAYWAIIGFREVEPSLINKHLKVCSVGCIQSIMAVDMINTGDCYAL